MNLEQDAIHPIAVPLSSSRSSVYEMPQILMEKELKAYAHVCGGLDAGSEPNPVSDKDGELCVSPLAGWEVLAAVKVLLT